MDSEIFINFLSVAWDFLVNVYNSRFFAIFKFLAGVYTMVLFVDLVLLLVLRGLGSDIRVGMKGADFPMQSKGKMAKKWAAIIKKLETEDGSQYKVAVLEADAMVDDILMRIGYNGESMTERLRDVTEAQIENVVALREAHEVRNKIIQDESFAIDFEESKRVLGIYEDYLKEVELL